MKVTWLQDGLDSGNVTLVPNAKVGFVEERLINPVSFFDRR